MVAAIAADDGCAVDGEGGIGEGFGDADVTVVLF